MMKKTAWLLLVTTALSLPTVGCGVKKSSTTEHTAPSPTVSEQGDSVQAPSKAPSFSEEPSLKSPSTLPTEEQPTVLPTEEQPSPSSEQGEKMTYEAISQQQAKEIMEGTTPHIILDVREENEFAQGHIPGAILLPHGQIEELAPTVLPDRNALILVYCRSGRRSKIAAEALANMGYRNVKEFGGIVDWKYEIVT